MDKCYKGRNKFNREWYMEKSENAKWCKGFRYKVGICLKENKQDRFKAMLVVRGFEQEKDKHYPEIYSCYKNEHNY